MTGQIVVESNVPLPVKYPFKQMKVGDSFALPTDVHRTTVSVAAARYGRANSAKFTIRKMPNGELRCWRLE